MKRVAIVIRRLKKTSGAARNALEQIRFFHALGYEVTLIGDHLDFELIKKNHGIPLYIAPLPLPLNGYLKRKYFSWRADRICKKQKFDLVIGHGDHFHQDILVLHNLVHLQSELVDGVPLPATHEVGRLHAHIIQNSPYRLLIANSKIMRNDLMSRFKVPGEKIEICFQSYSREQFNTKNKSEIRKSFTDELKSQHNFLISENETVIGLITSGEFKIRGLDYALKALAEIKKRHAVKFLIAGEDKNVSLYKEQARELGLANDVLFLPTIPAVEKYYHTLDLFFLPARFETFGRSILEAMACGLPVLTTNQTGAAEVVQSKQLIKNPDDIAGWVSVIEELITNRDWRRTIAKQNSERALLLDENQYSKRLLQILGLGD